MCQLTIITGKSLLGIPFPDQIKVSDAEVEMFTESWEDLNHSGKKTIARQRFHQSKMKIAKS